MLSIPWLGNRNLDIPGACEEGRMLVYGSLIREPLRVGADPCFVLAGRRILEVFWLGYWFYKLMGQHNVI
jgi:hypothetical protein